MILTKDLRKAIVRSKYVLSDAAVILGVSKQRVDQLLRQRGLRVVCKFRLVKVSPQRYDKELKQWIRVIKTKRKIKLENN
jgi:hypothetical protein